MFSAISAVFGRIFGTPKAIDNLTDKDDGLLVKVGSWVGNMNYTSEEKAEMDHETRKWALDQLAALAPFKVVQRVLAISIATFWIFVGINVLASIWIDAIYGTNIKADMLAFAFSDYIFWPVLAVLSLYFTGGVLPSRKVNS